MLLELALNTVLLFQSGAYTSCLAKKYLFSKIEIRQILLASIFSPNLKLVYLSIMTGSFTGPMMTQVLHSSRMDWPRHKSRATKTGLAVLFQL